MDQAQRAIQTESNEVLYEVADHIAIITLNAPERMNTISGPMLMTWRGCLSEQTRIGMFAA
jgi:enoyl-CoA hydratase/carnithine racemase